MKIYSYSEARQQFATVLNQARREGQVQIRRRDGQTFVVCPVQSGGSPLDVPAVSTHLGRQQIVTLVRESRRSGERFWPHGERTSSPRSSRHPRRAKLRRRH